MILSIFRFNGSKFLAIYNLAVLTTTPVSPLLQYMGFLTSRATPG